MKRVLAGLLVISQYDENASISAEHDEIFCGGEKSNPNKMSIEDLQTLEDNNWLWDVHLDTWHKFV